jgi:hypothetical protein
VKFEFERDSNSNSISKLIPKLSEQPQAVMGRFP